MIITQSIELINVIIFYDNMTNYMNKFQDQLSFLNNGEKFHDNLDRQWKSIQKTLTCIYDYKWLIINLYLNCSVVVKTNFS